MTIQATKIATIAALFVGALATPAFAGFPESAFTDKTASIVEVAAPASVQIQRKSFPEGAFEGGVVIVQPASSVPEVKSFRQRVFEISEQH